MDLAVRLGRLSLPNPILVASGTFGYATEAADFVDFRRLGGIVPKTVTAAPRKGNAPPRIVETPAGMLNAIGLDNDGIDHFLAHHLPTLTTLGTAVFINIAGKTEAEFIAMAAKLTGLDAIAAIELNLSCPNVSGGVDFAVRPELAARVTRGVMEVTGQPVFAKLTPNVTSVVEVAQAVAETGVDGLTLINTLLGTAIDWRKRRPILGNGFGGLSGPALKPVALRIVVQVARALKVPIIAAGGIATADDVMEFLIAGASAVQVGTANFSDPGAPIRVLDALPDRLAEAGVSSVRELVGTVRWPG